MMAITRVLAPGVAALAVLAAAAMPAAQEKAAEPPLFLTSAELDQAVRLPLPPPEGSDAEKAEIAELHHIEQARTPGRLEQARWDGEHEDGSMFVPTFGPAFDLAKLPATARMLADVRHDQKLAASKAKAIYRRKRPFIVDPSLQSCSKDEKPFTSYPSGHATMGWALATVLAEAWPGKTRTIMARAADYAESRVVCEVHFRSDIDAGKILGERVAQDLLAKPAFKAEEAAAAKELAALN